MSPDVPGQLRGRQLRADGGMLPGALRESRRPGEGDQLAENVRGADAVSACGTDICGPKCLRTGWVSKDQRRGADTVGDAAIQVAAGGVSSHTGGKRTSAARGSC